METAAADGFDPSAAAGESAVHQGSNEWQRKQGTQQGEQHRFEQAMDAPGAAAAGSDAQQRLGLGTALDSLAAVAAAAGHHFYEEQQGRPGQHSADYSAGDAAGKKQKRMRSLNEDFTQADDEVTAAAAAAASAARRSGSTGSRQHSGSGGALPGGPSQQWKRPRYNNNEMDPQQRHFEQAKQYQQRQQMLAAAQLGAAQGEGGQDAAGDAQHMDDAAGSGDPSTTLQQTLHHRLQQLLLPELGRQAILQSLDSATQCMVECGTATGIFSVDSERILCLCSACSAGKGATGPEFMPSEFERHGGMAACKKWRFSIKVADGGPGMTLGRWLDMRGVQISSYPTKFRNPVSRQKRPLELGKGFFGGGSAGPTIQLDVSQLLAGLVTGNGQLTGALKGALGISPNSTGGAGAGAASGKPSPSGAAASGSVGPTDMAALLGAVSSGGANSSAKLSELAAAVADMLVKEIPAAAAAAVAPLHGGHGEPPSAAAAVSSSMAATTNAMSAWPDTFVLEGPGPADPSMDVPKGYAIAAQVASGMPLGTRQEQQRQQRNPLPSGLRSGTNLGLLGNPSAQSVTHSARLSNSPGGHDPLALQAGNSVQHSSTSAILQMLQRYQQQHSSTRLPANHHPDQQQQQQGSASLQHMPGTGDDLPPLPPGMSGPGSLQMRRSSSNFGELGSAGRGAGAAAGGGIGQHQSLSGQAGGLGSHGPAVDRAMAGQLLGGSAGQQHAAGGEFGGVHLQPVSSTMTVDSGGSGGSGGRAAAAASAGAAATVAGREFRGLVGGHRSDSGGHAARRGSMDTELAATGHRSGQGAAQQKTVSYDAAAQDWGGSEPAATAQEPAVDWQKLVGSLENRLDVLLEDRRRKKQLEEQLAAQSATLAQAQAELVEERRRRAAVERKLAALSSLLLDKLEAAGDDSTSAAKVLTDTAAHLHNGGVAQQPSERKDDLLPHGTNHADKQGLGAASAAAAAIAAANAAAAAAAADTAAPPRLGMFTAGDAENAEQAAVEQKSTSAGSAGGTTAAAAVKEEEPAAPQQQQQQQTELPATDEDPAAAGSNKIDRVPAESRT